MKQADPVTSHLLSPRERPGRLSLVVPMYNEEAVISLFRDAVRTFASLFPGELELVLVNDGSSDRTLQLLVEWAGVDDRVRVLHLSRNFGHQIASTAGLDYATGDAVVLLDADLQDPLSTIYEMIDRYSDGYDVVYGQRVSRAGESAYKRFTAWLFYRIMRAFVYRHLPPDVGDFRLISRQCLDAVKQMRETHRFLRGMVAWVGFPQIAVAYHRQPRVAGSTKYPLSKMLAFSWVAATSFSTLPLRLSAIFGAVVGVIGIEEGIRALLAHLLGWYTVPGWTSLTVFMSLIGSAMLISTGILGEYIAKLYEQSKGRPLYIVARTFGAFSELPGHIDRYSTTANRR
jgi:glycosyltransferase involved in cell wall biosynthesis